MLSIYTPEVKLTPSINMFVAGSIEMGTAENWQDLLLQKLSLFNDDESFNLNVFNPRRADWDTSIDPTSNDPELMYQINWELDALDTADIIVLFLDPNTKSPISLLELGLYSGKRLIVYCPPEFYRSANVRVTCARHDIELHTDRKEWIDSILGTILILLERKITPTTVLDFQ